MLSDRAKQAAVAKMPAISDAEKKYFQPLTSNICTQLAAADARQPLAKLQPAPRHATPYWSACCNRLL